MKLYTQKGELMLPDGFTFDINVTNPIFSNDGASSVAATLPASNENCKLLDRPERLARSKRPVRTFPAVLQHGLFQKKCSMIMASCGKSEGIATSLAFEESEMYADFKGKNLKDVFETTSATEDDFPIYSMSDLMSTLHDDYYKSPAVHQNFAVFPVAVEKDDSGFKIINAVKNDKMLYEPRTITSGDENIGVPAGYGVSPFIWLHRVARLLFELSGYEVVRNDLENNPFSNIVLVNNCSDTFCKSTCISFRDLVPSVKVEDFILWLYDRFGVVVAARGRTVRIALQQNLLSAKPAEDFSQYVRESFSIDYPVPSHVVLDCDLSLDLSSPPDTTLLDFHRKHGVVRSRLVAEDPEANGIVFRKQTGRYVQITDYKSATDFKSSDIGSNYFRYDRDNVEETEEHESSDRFLPIVTGAYGLMPYIGERLHYNTAISGQEEESEQPIQICYAFWDGQKWFGSTQPYTYSGELMTIDGVVPYPELTPEGLYPYCWSRYNELIMKRISGDPAQIDYTPSMLMSMDICTPKLLNGVKVLVKSYSYQISSAGIKVGESVLQVLPSYQDQICDETVEFDEGSLIWSLASNKEEALRTSLLPYSGKEYEQYETDGLADYTVASVPSYAPLSVGETAKRRARWVRYRVMGYPSFGPQVLQVIAIVRVDYEEYFISVREDSE